MRSASFLAVCLNPTLQKTLPFRKVVLDEVNRTSSYILDASGKGVNVARVLSQLGRRSVHLTQLGGAFKDAFVELCRKDGLDLRWVDGGSEIRFCYTVIDQDAGTVTELVESGDPVVPGTEERLLDLFESVADEAGTLVISGSKTAGYSDAVFPRMTRIAAAKGLRVVLDVRGSDLTGSLPFGPSLVKPNLSEFVSTYLPGASPSDPGFRDRVAAAAEKLRADHGCDVVLTRGAGAVWVVDARGFQEISIKAVPPVNTTGSGDAFTAGLVSALADGADLKAAVAEGARCGALNAALLRCGVIR